MARTHGTTAGCIRIEERRWCYEHIAPEGNRAEMLRIRNEPSRGVYIGALFHYLADYDLDGLIDSARRRRSTRWTTAGRPRRLRGGQVLPPQHQAGRKFRRRFPEDVRRGNPDRAEVFRRIAAPSRRPIRPAVHLSSVRRPAGCRGTLVSLGPAAPGGGRQPASRPSGGRGAPWPRRPRPTGLSASPRLRGRPTRPARR